MPVISDGQDVLTVAQLEGALRAGDPSAVLVKPWILEKLIGRDRGVAAGVFVFPRVPAHVVSRKKLIDFSRREELPLDQAPPDCETLLVLARPDPDVLSSTPGPELLRRYWRMAFHARARAEARAALGREPDPRAAVQCRIERLGRTNYHEARFVLVRDKYLSHWADDLDSFAQVAAMFLELTFFSPQDLSIFFPLIEDVVRAAAVLGRGIDPDALLKATRPPGAAERDDHASTDHEPEAALSKLKGPAKKDASKTDRLLNKAVEADAVKNDVRAAIYRMRVYRASGTAAMGASRDSRTTVYADALKDLDHLVARLKDALALEDAVARQWRAWLGALLENAAGGWWNAEGRLLYDLQKVCVYHEREIYSVNVVDWLLDWAKRPLRRPQPGQRLVLMVKSLRSALGRTARVRLAPKARAELVKLLESAIDIAEGKLREFLNPRVEQALREGGLEPSSSTERVARDKLVEELLDEAVAKGYLTFGSLRDAVSRNQMKLNDLSSTTDYTRGDQLLRIDRRMEEQLDYVYHRAEIYLRWFHRLSSLFFATIWGRFLTKWVLLPFGGAFLILEALDHSVGKLIHYLASRPPSVRGLASSTARDITGVLAPTQTETARQAVEQVVKAEPLFSKWWLILLLGLFLLGLINTPTFRRATGRVFGRVWKVLRLGLVDGPKWLATRPAVKKFFGSLGMRLVGRYVLKPLIAVAVAFLFIPPELTLRTHILTLALVFFSANLAFNSRAGRMLEQTLLHSIRTTVARFGWEILVAIFRGIMNLFEAMLEAIDRVLYAVDEMLRFKAGQGRGAVFVKAVLGVFWFYIAYVTRFVINLLVEPQINPIKHFPVVTVSHKMLLPTIPWGASVLQTFGVAQGTAVAYAGAIVTSIPGVFGFLAWEFKENWKLYKANRPRTVKPVRVGSHGETIGGFLRPGFHSGTVPKIFGRIRKSRRRAEGWGILWKRTALRPGAEARHAAALEHVREEVEAFVEREFLALLNRHPLFEATPVELRDVRLGATTIRLDLEMNVVHGDGDGATEHHGGRVLTIRFEQRSLWILAGIDRDGFIASLSAEQWELFESAVLGLYKMAGVDLVEEHLRARLGPGEVKFDLGRNELIVWSTADYSAESAYALRGRDPMVAATLTPDGGVMAMPELRRADVMLKQTPLPRERWASLWEGRSMTRDAVPGVAVLPAPREKTVDREAVVATG